jgi:regulator of replication initiation timing
MKSSKFDNAIADMKRQLRAEPKSELIRTWLALYAQKVMLEIENDNLRNKLNETTRSGDRAEQGQEPKGSLND